jgi:hypothetical protein
MRAARRLAARCALSCVRMTVRFSPFVKMESAEVRCASLNLVCLTAHYDGLFKQLKQRKVRHRRASMRRAHTSTTITPYSHSTCFFFHL